jgi:hypothetical protein
MADEKVPSGARLMEDGQAMAPAAPGTGGETAAERHGNTRIERVLLVLPALNEAGKIGRTISKVPPGVVDTI